MGDLSLITLLLAVICFCMVVTTSLFLFAARDIKVAVRRLNAVLAHGDALLGRAGEAADWMEETVGGAYRKVHSFFQGVFGNGSRPKTRRVRGLRHRL